MLTVTEYLAKADELEARAGGCEPGSSQDAFRQMARQWRDLAASAIAVEAPSWTHPSDED